MSLNKHVEDCLWEAVGVTFAIGVILYVVGAFVAVFLGIPWVFSHFSLNPVPYWWSVTIWVLFWVLVYSADIFLAIIGDRTVEEVMDSEIEYLEPY